MFDTHCHLNYSQFENTYTKAINDARENGVKKILIPGTDINDSKRAIEIARDFNGVYASVGVHPTLEFTDFNEGKLFNDLAEIANSSEKVVAIGETGLDYYRYKSSPNVQRKVFNIHYKLAKMLGLSLIIHNRHATDDILAETQNYWDESMKGRIVFHCAQADSKIISFSEKYSCFIGVDGDVTFDNNKQEFIKKVPLERLVIETDSPNLIPEPYRGQKIYPNQPQYLIKIAEFVAKIKQKKVDEIIKITYLNANALYAIL